MIDPDRLRAAIKAMRKAEAERKAAGLPDPPNIFDRIEAEQTSAIISRYIQREYRTFESFERELDRELAGQKGMTAKEMIEYLGQCAREHDG